jgi:molybdopterin-guanine dinucleotide biosynthesis protein A
VSAALPAGIARHEITGIVLAGGLGRRMSDDGSGTDKGLRTFRGRPMASHVIGRLAPQVGPVAINTGRDDAAWRAFGLPLVPDEIGGFAGPLAGLHAALGWARTPWVVTAPCDTPFLPLDLVSRLARAAAGTGARIAVARTGSQPHPVFALVDRTLRDDLAAFLGSGRRRIDAWYAPLPVVEVDFGDDAPFRNINTADDLARWEREASADEDTPR